ncbi:MAG: HIT family protein [Acidimicrobiales bacterium]
MQSGCLVCREQTGATPVPGGPLQADELVVVFHVPPVARDTAYGGYLLVTPQRHVADFAGLVADEAAAVGVAIARWSAALRRAGAERVYVAAIGHGVDHLHVHLVPRWPGTPADVAWHALVERPDARRGSFDEIAAWVEDLRRTSP